MYGIRKCSDFILLHIAVQFSQDHFLKRLSFLYCVFLWLLFLLKPRNRVKGQASLVWAHALWRSFSWKIDRTLVIYSVSETYHVFFSSTAGLSGSSHSLCVHFSLAVLYRVIASFGDWQILYHCTIILCYWQFLSASVGFVSFSVFFLIYSRVGCFWPRLLNSGDGPAWSSSAAASLSHVSAFPSGASVLQMLLLTSPVSTWCLRVLLSWLLPSSRSRHLVGVAAWLPRVPQLCTSCMEPPSLLSTSLAPVSLFSGVVWPDVGEGPQPPCHPHSLLQAKSWTHPTPFFALHLQPNRALTLSDLSLLLLHCTSCLVFPSFWNCLEMLQAPIASHRLIPQEMAQVLSLNQRWWPLWASELVGPPLRALVWCARVPSPAWELLRTSLLALGSSKMGVRKWVAGIKGRVGFNTSNHIYGSISKSKENFSYFSLFVFRVILELLEHSLSYWRSPDC